MRRKVQTQDSEFETVLMRRFHLSPGQPEYVVVKRRLTQDDADRQRVERERSLPEGSRSGPTVRRPKRKAAHTDSAYEKQSLTARASGTVNKKESSRLSCTARGKHVKKASGHKPGNLRKRN